MAAGFAAGCQRAWELDLAPALARAAWLPARDVARLKPVREAPGARRHDWWVGLAAAPLDGWGLGLRGWRPVGRRSTLRLWRRAPGADQLALRLWRKPRQGPAQAVEVRHGGATLGRFEFGRRRAAARLQLPADAWADEHPVELVFDPPLEQGRRGPQRLGLSWIGLVAAGRPLREPAAGYRFDADAGRLRLAARGRLVLPLDLPPGARALELEARQRGVEGGPPAGGLRIAAVDPLGGEWELGGAAAEALGPAWSPLRFDLEPVAGRRLSLVVEGGPERQGGVTELRGLRLTGRGELEPGETARGPGILRRPPSLPPVRARRPDVVLVILDAARGDRFLDYPRQLVPRIRRMARRALVFERAYSECPSTACSIPNLLTGVPFLDLGEVFKGSKLGDEMVTLAETLAAAGYDTAAISSTPNNSPARNTHQGFATFERLWGAETMTRRAAERIAAQPADRPLFLMLHYLPPHQPYAPPPEFDRFTDPGYRGPIRPRMSLRPYSRGLAELAGPDLEQLVGLYDGNLLAADAAVGGLLDALEAAGRWDDTLLVLTSDHGEAFMEHGYQGHNSTLYDEMLHVPFILRLPGGRVPPDVDTRRLVTLSDAVPTILGALGLEPEPEVEGVDLLAAPADPARPRILYARTSHPGAPRLAARGPRFKAIVWPKANHQELYDLAADPGETENLVGARREVYTALALRLRHHVERFAAGRGAGEPVELTEEDRRELRALGYVE